MAKHALSYDAYSVYCKQWKDAVLCTQPADKSTAEDAVLEMYDLLNYKKPNIIWVASREAAKKEYLALRNKNPVKNVPWFSAWSWYSYSRSSDSSEVDHLSWEIANDVQTFHQIVPLQASLLAMSRALRMGNRIDTRNITVVESPRDLIVFAAYPVPKLHKSCAMAILISQPLVANHAILVDRPNRFKVDGRMRLHCPDGSAVRSRDGNKLFFLDGVHVPRSAIETNYTANQILHNTNAEVRRVLMNKYGLDKFLKDVKASVIDRQKQAGTSKYNELLRLDAPIASFLPAGRRRLHAPENRLQFLKLYCTTTLKQYLIPVNPRCTSVKQALAQSYGFTRPEQYDPGIET